MPSMLIAQPWLRSRACRADRDVDYRAGVVTVLGHEVRVDVQEGPDPSATPLLLLMGLGGNVEMWEPFRAALMDRTGATTVAYDVPGTGDSPTPRRPLPMWTHGRLAVGVADAVDLRTFDVLGLSWGGLLAQQVALTAPRRVRRLVLANTNYGLGSVPGGAEAWRVLATPTRYGSGRAFAHAAHALGGEGAMPAEHTAARLGSPPSPRGYLYQLLALVGWSSLPLLPFLRQRVLVLNGDDDRAVPLVNSRIMARLLPDAELAVVAGGGHLMLFERTPEVVERVGGFLARP
jgi:poly(3-hydroxyoctanoate) depolymerase